MLYNRIFFTVEKQQEHKKENLPVLLRKDSTAFYQKLDEGLEASFILPCRGK